MYAIPIDMLLILLTLQAVTFKVRPGLTLQSDDELILLMHRYMSSPYLHALRRSEPYEDNWLPREVRGHPTTIQQPLSRHYSGAASPSVRKYMHRRGAVAEMAQIKAIGRGGPYPRSPTPTPPPCSQYTAT